MAKRERLIEIDPPAEEEEEMVDCQLTVPQLDTIFRLLSPRAKAMAVLNGLNEEVAA